MCESRGGRPGIPVPNSYSSYGLYGCTATLNEERISQQPSPAMSTSSTQLSQPLAPSGQSSISGNEYINTVITVSPSGQSTISAVSTSTHSWSINYLWSTSTQLSQLVTSGQSAISGVHKHSSHSQSILVNQLSPEYINTAIAASHFWSISYLWSTSTQLSQPVTSGQSAISGVYQHSSHS